MLERFLKLKDEIRTILLRFPKSPRILTASEIQEAQEVITLLKPIEAASKEICGDHYITASKIIPIVNMLHQKVLDLNFETQAGQCLKKAFDREMARRFGKINDVHLLAIATLMDPR
ncbi:hypothetical protein QE152_g30058 [Popillia japonica]|uniref:Uncharacterized protein n=1 Tax=Popillia japonica TaxID=7064 RepID=A0AAW1JF12_POPJA